jgi:serine phosphatase RsbU (regulator of sigma subunit)
MSIAAKLIIASSVMLAGSVAIVSWVSVDKISEQSRELSQQHEDMGTQLFERESVLVTKSTAQTVSYQVATNAWNEIGKSLEAALEEHNALESGVSLARRPAKPKIQWMMAFENDADLSSAIGVWRTQGAPQQGPDIDETRAELREDVSLRWLIQRLVPWAFYGPLPVRCASPEAHPLEWMCEAPIFFSERQVGWVWMRASAGELQLILQGSENRSVAREAAYRRNVLLVAGGILLLGILLAGVQGLSLARPISALTTAAGKIAGGDFASRVPTERRDELGVLARAFNSMAGDIGELMKEQKEKARLEHEMSLARSVQQSMLPPSALERHEDLKVLGYCSPASSCGGDWWMYRKLSGGRMLLVVGDATGHGIHSAMIASTARGAVEALAELDEKLLVPEQVLRAVDSAIRNVGEHHVMMTAFAAVLDSRSGLLHYANAGQNFPYILGCGAQRLLGEAAIVAIGGNPLGDREIPVDIRGGSRQLAAGDLFVCFTDGLVERASPSGAMFGDRRLLRALRGQSMAAGDSLVALRERVVAAVEEHADGEVAGDDITFVMCQYDPPATAQYQSTGTG